MYKRQVIVPVKIWAISSLGFSTGSIRSNIFFLERANAALEGLFLNLSLIHILAAVRALMPVAGAEEWADCPVKEMVRLPEALPFRLI